MKTSLVLTLIGSDRPGLVESLAQLVARHDGNWEESRMAHLAGKFAGILRIEVPEAKARDLVDALGELQGEGLRIIAEPSEVAGRADRALTLYLEVVGQDREGIVRDISHLLASRAVNVEELATSCEAAPLAGGTLFRARARLQAPRDTAVEELRSALEALSDDLVVDLGLDAPEEAAD